MSQPGKFLRAPVVETVLGVQFDPLISLRSHHYGLFWLNYLKELGWNPISDEKPLPLYIERFGDKKLFRQKARDAVRFDVRMKLKKGDQKSTLQFQSDKLYYSWSRDENQQPSYSLVRPEYDEMFSILQSFGEQEGIGTVVPNLWEVTYINQISAGTLWQKPSDWHRVLPKLLANAGEYAGLNFATYDGSWYFEIPPQRGRITLRVAKMIVNQSSEPALFVMLTARGTVSEELSWSDGLTLGHDANVKLFCEIISDEAKTLWGFQP